MSLFKNRSFNVKVVKDQPSDDNTAEINFDPMQGVQVAAAYADIAKDFVTHAALTIGGVVIACKIVGRFCK